MKHNVMLTVASLLSLLFMTIHLTHDVIRQAEGAVKHPIPVLVFALWLYGTLMLSDRVWGYLLQSGAQTKIPGSSSPSPWAV